MHHWTLLRAIFVVVNSVYFASIQWKCEITKVWAIECLNKMRQITKLKHDARSKSPLLSVINHNLIAEDKLPNISNVNQNSNDNLHQYKVSLHEVLDGGIMVSFIFSDIIFCTCSKEFNWWIRPLLNQTSLAQKYVEPGSKISRAWIHQNWDRSCSKYEK